jgi:hypothetical protein
MKLNYRIKVPRRVIPFKELVEKISARNAELGDSSPLRDFNIAGLSEEIIKAVGFEQKSVDFKRMSENETQKRDNKFRDDVKPIERKLRKVLEGYYFDNIQELGNWGYEVDRS